MSTLEDAVETLAGALDALETKLDDRLQELATSHEAQDAARRQARAARGHAISAAGALSDAIVDLRALLNGADEEEKG